MVIMRLQRVGRKNDPSFRVVVTDKQNGPKSGKFIEVVGSYDARRGKPQLNSERISYWLSQGAQVSATLHNLLVDAKLRSGPKLNVLPPRKPVEEKAEEKKTSEQPVAAQS
jgi:small subunit ribosomal protein S16